VINQFWISRDKIKWLFHSVPSISLTCDLWTSPNTKAILAMTAHWVNNDYELKEILLDALEIRGAHTGKEELTVNMTTLEEFSTKKKFLCYW
jgi:hypothetical protein